MRVFSFLFLLGVIVLSSCKQKHRDLPHLPKDAAIVVHMNNKSILEKVPLSEWQKTEIFKSAMKDSGTAEFLKDALQNPDNTGIDIDADMFWYFMQDAEGQLLAFHGHLKDAGKFKTFAGNFKEATISESGKTQMFQSKGTAGIWDNDRFLMLVGIPKEKKKTFEEMLSDTLSVSPAITRNLTADATRLFNLKKEESLADQKKFINLLNEKGDMHFWMNSYAFYNNNPDLASMAMFNLDKLYKDNFITATTSFDAGQINTEVNTYTSKEMTKVIRKYAGDGINKELMNKFDGKDLAGIYFWNFDPEGLKAMLDLAGLTGIVNMGMGLTGFSLDDIAKAFKGDFVFGVQKLNPEKMDDASVIFGATVQDKDALNKIMNSFKKLSPEASEKVLMETNDKFFVAGNQPSDVKKFINAKPGDNAYWDKLSGSAAGGFIDIEYLLHNIPVSETDSAKIALYNLNKNMWKNIYATGGKFRNGSFKQHIEVNLMNKDQNSLSQLNNFFNQLIVLEKERKVISSSIPDSAIEEWGENSDVNPTVMPTEL